MKALSLWQPWATLIAIGAKQVETRSWASPYLGTLAIHSAATNRPELRETCNEEPFRSVLRAAGYMPIFCRCDDPNYAPHMIPLGGIVAVVKLIACHPTNPRGLTMTLAQDGKPFDLPLSAQELAFGDYHPGRFGWVLEEVRKAPRPIPAKGGQKIWDWEPPAKERAAG